MVHVAFIYLRKTLHDISKKVDFEIKGNEVLGSEYNNGTFELSADYRREYTYSFRWNDFEAKWDHPEDIIMTNRPMRQEEAEHMKEKCLKSLEEKIK